MMDAKYIEQVRSILGQFQDGYKERDMDQFDAFIKLFVQNPDVELIGIGASERGGVEWFEGVDKIREIIQSDWEYWGDVEIDVAGAKITAKGDAAWLTAAGTLEQTDTLDKAMPQYLEQMKDLLDNRGKLVGSGDHDGALFVLTADRAFVQAGLNTDELDDDDDGWDSNILRNTEQLALTIAGVEDMISIEAQLVSTDPAMAQSLGGIANGLISLQAFNSELDPELKNILLNTKIDVTDKLLSISTVITPKLIVKALDD